MTIQPHINIITGKDTKYLSLMYNLLYSNHLNGVNYKWLCYTKSIFDGCGLSNIWLSQTFSSKTWLVKCIKQKLCDQFIQQWSSDIEISSKGISYRLFVDNFEMQHYLLSNISTKNKILLCKFRTSNHKLPIETGRWSNIPKSDRICTLCFEDIGDEFHYIMVCKCFDEVRKQYIPNFYRNNPNVLKYYSLFSTKKLSLLNNICKFISVIFERVSPPG